MKKFKFTKTGAYAIFTATIVWIILKPISYYNLYFKDVAIRWRSVIYLLIFSIILLLGKNYFPSKPKEIRKWLYFISFAAILDAIGRATFLLWNIKYPTILFYTAEIIFIILALTNAYSILKGFKKKGRNEGQTRTGCCPKWFLNRDLIKRSKDLSKNSL